jgi:hypothetical protein
MDRPQANSKKQFKELLVILLATAPSVAEEPAPKLSLHAVATPIKANRLLAMSMDEDGCIWTGSFDRAVHRYDPHTGKTETIALPEQGTASACLCAGKKVYILGQTYPKLTIYDPASKKFTAAAYPSAKPNVWYGIVAGAGKHLYLFDRGASGIIKWDTQTETGQAIAWPYYKAPFPGSGIDVPADKAIWCRSTDSTSGPYNQVGIARLDLAKDEFTGWFDFPKDDRELKPFTDPATTLFFPSTLKGKLAPFDFKDKRWCKFLDVPQYGQLFGFIGSQTAHKGRYYFSLSTFNGTDTSCDGKPYHFCNAILEFDPQTRKFDFLTLEVKDAYHQIAYMLSAGGEFFATGSNIREPDGKLNRSQRGETVFWQTTVPAK